MFSLFRLCRKDKFHEKNGNNVEATFDFVEAIVDFVKATFVFVERIVRLVAFDDVASILLLDFVYPLNLSSAEPLLRHRSQRYFVD